MADNLARFARLSGAAKERERGEREAAARASQEQWVRDQDLDEQRARMSPEFLAGPPGGCHVCYAWQRHKLGGWGWDHQAAIDPVTKRYSMREDGEDPFPCEFCMHDCHGPKGEPLPLIAYA